MPISKLRHAPLPGCPGKNARSADGGHPILASAVATCRVHFPTKQQRPQPKPTSTVSPTVLQDRWLRAKRGSDNPRHTEMECICTSWFSRTAKRRECGNDLRNCVQIFLSQWPPLRVVFAMVAKHCDPGHPLEPPEPQKIKSDSKSDFRGFPQGNGKVTPKVTFLTP